jgi:hypothetical protein
MWMVFVIDANSKNMELLLGPSLICLAQSFYIAITQNDDGIDGSNENLDLPSNLFVLSQSGTGHIPLPLWRHHRHP